MVTSKDKPNIGIDIRMALWSGIGRYIRGLLSGLGSFRDFNFHLYGRKQEKGLANPHFNFSSLNSPVYGISEQFTFPFEACSCQCLHVPHYNAPVFWPKKLVVTIHDLIHLHFKNHLRSSFARYYASTMLPVITQKADAIIAVSEYTKQNLIQTLNVSPKKITVIHHGIDPSFFSKEQPPHTSAPQDKPYFLYVGLLKVHKNIGTLLEAFQQLKKKINRTDIHLILVGEPDLKQDVVQHWLRTIEGDPAMTLKSRISDEELKQLYRNALAFVFPSLYEGFGFPLLEAMASGAPIIGAQAASIPEVLGDAGLYFDPKSVSELTNVMEKMLTNSTLRETLIQKGMNRISSFNWTNCAEKTCQVYETVLHAN